MSTRDTTRIDKGKHRILIVDDHPIVRHGLGQLISRQSDMMVCGEASDSTEALLQVASTRADAAIVDITLEQSNGLELIEQLKADHPHLKILVSSMHDESLFAERAMRAGADGYISKGESIRNVIDAMRKVLSGDVYLSQRMLSHLVQRPSNGNSGQHDALKKLSNREMEIFEMIGRGLGIQQIAQKLKVSISTVETHRRKIRTKLNIENATLLSHYAYQWVQEGH